jgi:hypothetical protein
MSEPEDRYGIQPEPRSESPIPRDLKAGAREDSSYSNLTPYPTSGLPELPPEKSSAVEVVAGLILGSLVGAYLGLSRVNELSLVVFGTCTLIGALAGRLTAALTWKAGTFSAWNFLTALARVLFVLMFGGCLGPLGVALWAIGESRNYEEGR